MVHLVAEVQSISTSTELNEVSEFTKIITARIQRWMLALDSSLICLPKMSMVSVRVALTLMIAK